MDYKHQLLDKINNKTAVIGIIGMGYVGLPLALTFAEKGFSVMGFDVDQSKVDQLNSGQSYIKHIMASRIKNQVPSGKLKTTSDFSRLPSCDVIIICVPTPLNDHREPDISYIENSGKIIAQYLQLGQLIVLESSTYPGTTEEILLPMFANANSNQLSGDSGQLTVGSEKNLEGERGETRDARRGMGEVTLESSKTEDVRSEMGDERREMLERDKVLHSAQSDSSMIVGVDFFLAFSPEREDPNNPDYQTSNIPKVVGGVTSSCLEVAVALYNQVINKTVPVSSPRVAEAAKLLENIYRSVNIALVNELKMIFDRMNIDVWEVIEAAKTKPFGFQPFYPGPGLGGHCIPIDPFYLTWIAREYDINTKFIELAGEINTHQPYYVVEKIGVVLDARSKTIKGSKILILGVAYKKNVDDMRESPALKLIEILQSKGAQVDYHDPFVPKLPPTRKYKFEMSSVQLISDVVAAYDLVLLVTDHDSFGYKLIADSSKLIIDTRNAFERKGIKSEKIFKA
ncbi:MAG: nucleotide sugar dehydrogenase [Bacteroidota bacterium]